MKYQVKKVNGKGINEFVNRINELYGLIGKCSEKIKNAQDLEKQMLEPCNGMKEKLVIIRDNEYKKLDKRIKDNRKMKTLYIIEKESIEFEMENFIVLLVLNAIALNIEYLKDIPCHYKRALNVINEALEETNIKVYKSCYGRLEAYMNNAYINNISTTVSCDCTCTYKEVFEKEDTYKHSEILSLAEIKREIEELMPEINAITMIETYKKEYIKKVNGSLEQFKSYSIKSYVKKESGFNDLW